MRVVSPLADIEFGIGRISRSGRDLLIESSADSTLETRVVVSPRDALRSIAALAASPKAWLFLLSLPFAGSGGDGAVEGDGWAERRQRTGINKPW